MTEKYIRNEIKKLIAKHNTIDPFELCALEDIVIKKEYLGNLKGYYYKSSRIQQICLNTTLDDDPVEFKKLVCAHELGHAILHRELNTMFLCKFTHFETEKFEVQANLFAKILISLNYSEDMCYC